jgi:hypothetical protein
MIAQSSGVSFPGLSRIEFGTPKLSEVVQEPGAAQVAQLAGSEAEDGRDPDRRLGDPLGKARGEGRLGVHHACERLGDEVEAGVVGKHDPLGRLERGDMRGHVR